MRSPSTACADQGTACTGPAPRALPQHRMQLPGTACILLLLFALSIGHQQASRVCAIGSASGAPPRLPCSSPATRARRPCAAARATEPSGQQPSAYGPSQRLAALSSDAASSHAAPGAGQRRWQAPAAGTICKPGACGAAQGHIALDTAVFPEGTPGLALDTLARMPLWAIGLNYRHGTGHGVGAALNVHEGPQSISARWGPLPPPEARSPSRPPPPPLPGRTRPGRAHSCALRSAARALGRLTSLDAPVAALSGRRTCMPPAAPREGAGPARACRGLPTHGGLLVNTGSTVEVL